ncbi:MAG: hypothetical protein K6B40_01750 [Firmicutes bacterium]|nr:hypothetical protein [Bacillota bacterium]
MNEMIIDAAVNVGLILLAAAVLLCLYRIVRGPSAADRAVGSDALAACVMGGISLCCIKFDSLDYLPAVWVVAVLGFISMLVIAKFIGGDGDILD